MFSNSSLIVQTQQSKHLDHNNFYFEGQKKHNFLALKWLIAHAMCLSSLEDEYSGWLLKNM